MIPTNFLRAKFLWSIIFVFFIHVDLYAQREVELKRCYYYRTWYDWAVDTLAPDSFQFSVKDKADRFLLVDRMVNPKSGKLHRKDFGGYAFNVDGNYFAQHMNYTEYINDAILLVRYHVFGLLTAYIVRTDDPIIGLERHNYTGFGIIGDAIAESVKNRKDRSNAVWKSEDGKAHSVIFFGSILNEDGNMEFINNQPVLLSENGLKNLASHFKMGSAYVDKTDWTAEEIGAFLTEINESVGKSIVRFEGLDFSTTGE